MAHRRPCAGARDGNPVLTGDPTPTQNGCFGSNYAMRMHAKRGRSTPNCGNIWTAPAPPISANSRPSDRLPSVKATGTQSRSLRPTAAWCLEQSLVPGTKPEFRWCVPGSTLLRRPAHHPGQAAWLERLGLNRLRKPLGRDQARSKRSAFITLVHAATKSATNFACASSAP
jgi:hypothetical protein